MTDEKSFEKSGKMDILPRQLFLPMTTSDLLFIDKPAGWTSHDVVAKLRGVLKIRKIGHAGTLDPFATGLLILGVGPGTKQLTALVGLDKTYETTLKLGATSTTFDPEGKITETALDPLHIPSLSDIEQALDLFRGGYEQRAPLHSAKKRAGKKLYELARAGQATEDMRPVKHIRIDELTVIGYAWPELRLRVSCSSGTYIRSLGDDIGRALGVGAYVQQLRRTRIGNFELSLASSLESLLSSQV